MRKSKEQRLLKLQEESLKKFKFYPPDPKIKKEKKRYIKKLVWIYLTKKEKRSLFSGTKWGDFTKIALLVNCNPESIRRLFKLKPDKILKKHFDAIQKFKQKNY